MVFLLNLASYSQQHCHYQSSQTAKKYCDRFFCPCGAEFISFPLSFCCGRWQNFSPFFLTEAKQTFFFLLWSSKTLLCSFHCSKNIWTECICNKSFFIYLFFNLVTSKLSIWINKHWIYVCILYFAILQQHYSKTALI